MSSSSLFLHVFKAPIHSHGILLICIQLIISPLQMLELAFSRMLGGRHISDADADSLKTEHPDIHSKFWNHLQMLLKKMVAMTLPTSASKSCASQPQTTPNRCGEASRLRELYKMSLKSSDLRELHKMHTIWTSKLEC